MISSLFIANRGEIAVRILRACKELGIKTYIGFSEPDRNSLAVQWADKAVCIGPAASTHSYLNMDNIITAAQSVKADALHPGVGFLSENSIFAEKVIEEGMAFVGPNPDSIAASGDKIKAKHSAQNAKIPLIPGSDSHLTDVNELKDFAKKYSYPLIIKAASGGGGKGMRIVRSDEEADKFFSIAQNEAEKSFSDSRVYVEKYLEKPRHVEVQVLSDGLGTVLHLGERDCSVQRAHQKLIEESPSPIINADMRERMGEAAIRLFRELNYKNAGTVEFLVEGDNFYFMEVNSRIQVEHPVTELITGIDLIHEQLSIASGNALKYTQEDIRFEGYAMECRINALSSGWVDTLFFPSGPKVRVDSFLYQGYQVSPFYDSLLAKLLVQAKSRREGVQKMLCALDELEIKGRALSHNASWFTKILKDTVFRSGNYSNNYLEESGILKEPRT